jgi:hypothetical protein
MISLIKGLMACAIILTVQKTFRKPSDESPYHPAKTFGNRAYITFSPLSFAARETSRNSRAVPLFIRRRRARQWPSTQSARTVRHHGNPTNYHPARRVRGIVPASARHAARWRARSSRATRKPVRQALVLTGASRARTGQKNRHYFTRTSLCQLWFSRLFFQTFSASGQRRSITATQNLPQSKRCWRRP